METKTSQLQIRVSPGQKVALKRLASAAGQSVSAYVLSQVLPRSQAEFQARASAVRGAVSRSKALSDLRLYLSDLSVEELRSAVASYDPDGSPLLIQNLVAATVEQALAEAGIESPDWVEEVEPPERPYFASDLRSLRPHLMRVTPPAFKRRNVYLAPWADVRR